jgi:hypothetical protein
VAGDFADDAAMIRWDEILRDYDERHCCDCEDQIAWSQSQPSLRAAIEVAARATNRRERRYSHQWRIRRDSIARATAALLSAQKQLAHADSFDAIHDVIQRQLRDVPGIGELYRYDTAFRIAAYLNLFPTRVYLHAGTRAGARALGLAYEKGALEMHEVPVELRHRRPHEVEDILCIFKARFANASNAVVGCGPAKRTRRVIC